MATNAAVDGVPCASAPSAPLQPCFEQRPLHASVRQLRATRRLRNRVEDGLLFHVVVEVRSAAPVSRPAAHESRSAAVARRSAGRNAASGMCWSGPPPGNSRFSGVARSA